MTTPTAATKHSQPHETWNLVESGALKALAKIKFSTEDRNLYPPLCKLHIWQQALLQAVAGAAKLSQDSPSIKLMHGLLPYDPMETITFSMDAAYRSTQFSKEELAFLRKLRLESFLCNVPWGVVHAVRALEAIDTLQEDTLQVTLKGELMPLFSENWRELFLKIFHLAPRGEGEKGDKLQLQDLFPSLGTIQEGQKNVKVGDCRVAGSKRPLRLLSSFFCLNTSGQYSISIHFAKLVLAALNGEKVDWPLEFLDEFKTEIIALHRHQQQDKPKVVKTAIGPHLTLLIEQAELLGKQERKVAGFGTIAGLTMTERVPPPRKRKLEDETKKGKMETVIRVSPKQPPSQSSGGQGVQSTDATEEPQKRRIIQAAEKWQVPESTSTMINQICFTHRRLEQLLTTFTSKAGEKFVKKMDDEFQELQVQANQHYNQGLRFKEPLTTNEHEVEKSLLHIEIRKLKKELTTLNEGYAEQVEMVFELQDQLSTSEGMVTSLTEARRVQQAQCDQMTGEMSEQNRKLEVAGAELETTQQQLATLQIQYQEQEDMLTALREELRQSQLPTSHPTPDTPRSENRTPHGSDNNAQADISGLYSMVEGTLHQPDLQQRAFSELQQELTYTRRERDEYQVTLERLMESPHNIDEEALGPADIPRSSILPKAAIYHQLTANIPPFTTIMQYYHALKGLNLWVSRVPLLRPGTTLSKPQFEHIWEMADPTARDTIAFMWVTGDIKMHVGIMELVTGSPPFYIGRFVLRTLSFISHHYSTYYNHTPLHRLPTLKSYPNNVFRQIREFVRTQPITFTQALKNLTLEDTTICHEATQQYKWLHERHPHRLPGPYSVQQIQEYAIKVIREKDIAISTRRFGTTSTRTILQPDHYAQI